MRPIRIKNIARETFKTFGTVIELTQNQVNGWDIVIREKRGGWRIGVFEFGRRKTRTMECHPDSMETFEPVRGTGVILVAPHGSPEKFQAFLLDKPVCLHKGVWHEVVSLSETTTVKITENSEVKTEFFSFENECSVCFSECGSP